MMDLLSKKCVPCEVGTPPMTKEQSEKYLKEVDDWELVDPSNPDSSGKGLKIRRRFKFESYIAGVDFVNKVAKIAEKEGHHPDIYLGYKRVSINLMTHNIGGLSENDFILAARINILQQEHGRSEAK